MTVTQSLSIDPTLQRALDTLMPGIAVGHRVITAGDEDALTDDEAQSIASEVAAARRASGAARIVARELLARFGQLPCPLLKTASGLPAWPREIVGSLAHDDQIAVAAIALRHEFEAVGVDIEPAEPLPPDVVELVATAREHNGLNGDPLRGRLLFAAKEAVYKALYPRDRVFLEYHDIEVDFAGGKAIVSNGHVLELRFCRASHVVALAFARAAATVAA